MIKVIWPDETLNKTSLGLEVEYQKRKYEVLRSLLVDKFTQDIDKASKYKYFTTVQQFINSPLTYGFCTCLVYQNVEKKEASVIKAIDHEGIYSLELDQVPTKEKTIIEGIHLGFYLSKRKVRKGLSSFNKLKTFLAKEKPTLNIDKYIFPGFKKEAKWRSSRSKVVVISDIHVGSITFCEENFVALISKINNSDTNYVILNGDLVDGVEVFPNHREELEIDSYGAQYKKLINYLMMLRKDITIVIIPGNHDYTGKIEPQFFPKIIKDMFYERLANVIFSCNPGFIKIDEIYFYLSHGTSFNSVLARLPYLQSNECTEVARYLMNCRDISPIRKAIPIISNKNLNHLIPEETNIICTGHMHCQGVKEYRRNQMIVTTGAWQHLTPYMDLLGFKPDIAQCVYIDLAQPMKYENWDLRDETTQNHSYHLAIVKKQSTN